jgi:hypothetical protein
LRFVRREGGGGFKGFSFSSTLLSWPLQIRNRKPSVSEKIALVGGVDFAES